MSRKVLEVSDIYQKICIASMTGRKRGISIKELKKQFGMKNRDIKTLVDYLNNYDDPEPSFYFNIYRLTPHYTAQKDSLIYESLDEEDIEEIDLDMVDMGKILDDMYLRIEHTITVLQEKLDEDGIDVSNASFMHSISDEGKKIFNIRSHPDYIIIRSEEDELGFHAKKAKTDWIIAAVRGFPVSFEQNGDGRQAKKETVRPLGIYYNRFLHEYICVYLDKEENHCRIMLDKIQKMSILEEEEQKSVSFSIYDYIKKIQTTKMVVRVYKEGNVAKKLKKLLEENQLAIEEDEEYVVFSFMTEDAGQYNDLLKSYGRSVIVIEPEDIRMEMIQSTKAALQYYKNLPDAFTTEDAG